MTERKLRSGNEPRSGSNLFNFEGLNKLVHRDKNIVIKPKSNSGKLFTSDTPVDLPLVAHLETSVVLKPIGPGKCRTDELQDSLYDGFHRKMKKEERKMVSLDRMKLLSEVDTLQTNLGLLQQYDWIKYLGAITQLNDSKNGKEAEYKKLLTIYEIKRLLQKYDSWKKRDDQLSNDYRLYNNRLQQLIANDLAKCDDPLTITEELSLLNGPTPEDEYNILLKELKKRRSLERRRIFGATITLKLSNGVALVIDPVLPPKFVKFNSKLRCDGKSIAFGASLPLMTQKNYTIPSKWKSHADDKK